MHLAFLTPEYPHPLSTSSGGLGTSIKNMVVALGEKGNKVTVFIYGQKQDKIFTEKAINFHFIQQQQYKFLGWYLHRKYLQNYINQYIVSEQIDAIEAPDWTGITAVMKLKCALAIRFHGSDAYFCQLENRPQKKKNFWFEKKALERADHLLSVSKFTADTTCKIFKLKKDITVIPNSIDTEIFKPLSIPIEPDTLLYFGTIIRKKGVLELAEIFNIIISKKPQIRLYIAGRDVPDFKNGRSTRELFMEKLSPQAVEQVIWLGVLPYEDIKKEIAKAAVVVLPSFAEALPMTWIEAMAMEKALVTSDIGWAKEVMINGETGFMVHPEKHEKYAERTLELLQDPILSKKMGRAARNQIKTYFSTEVVVEKNISYYLGLLKK